MNSDDASYFLRPGGEHASRSSSRASRTNASDTVPSLNEFSQWAMASQPSILNTNSSENSDAIALTPTHQQSKPHSSRASDDVANIMTLTHTGRQGSSSNNDDDGTSVGSSGASSRLSSIFDGADALATAPVSLRSTGLREQRQKPSRQIVKELTVEVMPALLVSVAGSVLAGYILGQIQDGTAFETIPAFFIMVPVLMNLKSNIELNMATRLSTLANLGVFDNKSEGTRAMRSNMELLLLQSTVVGTCVGLISALLSLLSSDSSSSVHKDHSVVGFLKESSILLATGIGCAVIGSAVIGVLNGFTVVVSTLFGIDPDNIGTPIASSFGDMSTLLILGAITSVLTTQMSTVWPLLVIVAFLTLGVLLFRVVKTNEQMAHHISEGWLPLLFAAVTSSIAGVVVERYAEKYPGMPALVPVVNGIGGNIGTVFASRLSTSLHRRQAHASEHNLVMLILLLINIPIQVGFLAMHRFFDPSLTTNFGFVIVYTAATIAHGAAMLTLARFGCHYLWARGYDPDDYVNPFITGTGDMLGTILLALVFIIV